MSDLQLIQVIALFGWLVIAGSAMAAYRLNMRKAVVMALIWIAIFVGMIALFTAVRA